MLSGLVTSDWSAETKTPGGGPAVSEHGNMIQYLAPLMTAFHALRGESALSSPLLNHLAQLAL